MLTQQQIYKKRNESISKMNTDIVERLDSYLSERSGLRGYDDHIHSLNDVTITMTDLRDSSAEITSLRKRVEELEAQIKAIDGELTVAYMLGVSYVSKNKKPASKDG